MKTLCRKFGGKLQLPLVPLLFLLFIPLTSALILGYQFIGQSVQHVPTMIVDHDNSTLSRSLIRYLETNQAFNVKYFSDNNHDVEALLYQGKIAVGLIIPRQFAKDLLNGKAPKVMVVYDGTQMSMTAAVKARISEVFSTIKTGYLMQIMQGKLGVMPAVTQNTALPMSFTTRYLGNPTKSMPNFYLGGMVLNIAQLLMFLFGIELVEAGAQQYRRLWLKGLVGGLLGVVAMGLGIGVLTVCFQVPFRGSIVAALSLAIPFAIGMTNVGMFFRLLTRDRLISINLTMLVSTTFMLTGYTFPTFAMPDCLQGLFKFIPFYYFGFPMRDITLLGSDFSAVMPAFGWLIQFTVLLWSANWGLFQFGKRAVQAQNEAEKLEKPLDEVYI